MAMPAAPVMKDIRVTTQPHRANVPATEYSRPAKVAVPTTVTQRPVAKTAKVIDRSTQNQHEIERQLKELSEQVEKLRQAVEKTQPKQ
jgi:peptidoglycan hydrolase CwlO-like protein